MIELIILVDYENVQPAAEDLADLEVGKHLLKVFHGPGQNSMPIKLATTLMPVGAAVEFIQCEKAGKDALDFHLSFHFGRLSVQHPQAQYVIVSRDRKGFSQLIEHGSKLGIKVTLVPSLRDEDMNDDGTPVTPPAASRAPRETRETREPREPRAPRSRAGSKPGRSAATPAPQGQRRGGGREAVRDGTREGARDVTRDGTRDSARDPSRDTTREAGRGAPRRDTARQAAVAAPAPVTPPQADEDVRVQVERLMADIVASDEDADSDAPVVVAAPVAEPAPVAKKAPAKKAAARKVEAKKAPTESAQTESASAASAPAVKAPAEKVVAKKAAAKKVAAKKAATKKVAAKAVTAAPVEAPVAAPAEAPAAAPAPAKKAARKSAARKTVAVAVTSPDVVATPAAPAPTAPTAPSAPPALTPAPTPSTRQLRDEPMPSDTRKALDSLKRLGDGKRPVKIGSLRAHLRSHLRADLSEAGVEALLDAMRAQGWISELDHGKVAYQLP
ncbi:PIN domain-containing protein [Sphaerotilus mobilis]|uniref:PIN-like domain-containing protein n=1 Tax=Sphaerotilus mobilis TaxID=47994 RepID=A0A4V2EX14_9BURK|nr:PIN domain-containing protein [Sphaerotilus mobilis]RZS57900.1 hypothetical protein EV685_0174 [Sphaerotilus mobilis]